MASTLTKEDRAWIRKEIARQIAKACIRSDRLMTSEEAAAWLNVSTKTLRRFMKEYGLATKLDPKSEKLLRFRPEDLKKFVRLQWKKVRDARAYGRRKKTIKNFPQRSELSAIGPAPGFAPE